LADSILRKQIISNLIINTKLNIGNNIIRTIAQKQTKAYKPLRDSNKEKIPERRFINIATNSSPANYNGDKTKNGFAKKRKRKLKKRNKNGKEFIIK